MGTELSQEKKIFYEEELKYKAAVSGTLGFRIGKMLNFLGKRSYFPLRFTLNGPYGIGPNGETFRDGLYVFDFDCEIFNAWMFNVTPGDSGTTELDALISPAPGDPFVSIFTTTPKIDSTATGPNWVGVGGSGTGLVAPVLSSSPILITAGSALRVDKVQSMANAEDCGLILSCRSR